MVEEMVSGRASTHLSPDKWLSKAIYHGIDIVASIGLKHHL